MASAATLDDFMAFNDQIAALADAGVPLDVGLGPTGSDAAVALERINASVARRMSTGAALAQTVDDEGQVMPAPYRAMVRVGLQSGDMGAAIDRAGRAAEVVDNSRFAFRAAFFYPLTILALVYLGMIGFCLYLLPVLEGIQRELDDPTGTGLNILAAVRNAMPYWAVAVPLAVLAAVAIKLLWQPERTSVLVSGLPGMAPALADMRAATFAQTAATLLEAETPIGDALRLAADASSDPGLSEGANALAAAFERGEVPDDREPAARRFPPFLRWALLHPEGAAGRPQTLHMAASVYRHAADRRAAYVRQATPIVACVLIGGVAVLLYGLALFVPVTEMLRSLAS